MCLLVVQVINIAISASTTSTFYQGLNRPDRRPGNGPSNYCLRLPLPKIAIRIDRRATCRSRFRLDHFISLSPCCRFLQVILRRMGPQSFLFLARKLSSPSIRQLRLPVGVIPNLEAFFLLPLITGNPAPFDQSSQSPDQSPLCLHPAHL